MSQILKEAFGIAAACSSHTEVAFFGSEMAICSSCGGSGIKRISEQRFRTCQDCLGRGVLQSVSSSRATSFTVAHSPGESIEKSSEVINRGLIKTVETSASAR